MPSLASEQAGPRTRGLSTPPPPQSYGLDAHMKVNKSSELIPLSSPRPHESNTNGRVPVAGSGRAPFPRGTYVSLVSLATFDKSPPNPEIASYKQGSTTHHSLSATFRAPENLGQSHPQQIARKANKRVLGVNAVWPAPGLVSDTDKH
jgi:hypothetical protein